MVSMRTGFRFSFGWGSPAKPARGLEAPFLFLGARRASEVFLCHLDLYLAPNLACLVLAGHRARSPELSIVSRGELASGVSRPY